MGKITTKALLTYHRAKLHKQQLDAQSRNLGKLIANLEAEFLEQVRAEDPDGDLARLETCGFEIEVEKKRKNVSWKGEFLKRLGEKIARQVTNAMEKVDKLTAVRPKSNAALRLVADLEIEAKKSSAKIAA